MKKLFKILAAVLLIFGLEKLIRTQTDGFRIGKIAADFDSHPEWDIPGQEFPASVLDQPYYFLGSGVQSYAFLSADGETVLKVFKHYHLPPSSTCLKSLPLPKFLKTWQSSVLENRQKRIDCIFSSAVIAFRDLREQTGVFYLNLNPTEKRHPKVKIYDKIGIKYDVDLDRTPFLLQKKADLLFSYLESHKEETISIIDSLFSCINARTQRGIINNDPIAFKNFGILNGEVIEIDIGSFTCDPLMKKPLFSKRELFFETLELKEWISKNSPEFSDYFEQKLLQAIRT